MSQPETLHLDTVIANHTQDLTGRVAAITGTTSGTGFICARELAKLGARVILLNRASPRVQASLKSLQTAVPGAQFEAVTCDLQDFASVRAAAKHILESYERLDILCNNAGVMALADTATGDGYDVQMQTNCLSHFLLTQQLYPLLAQSPDGRVVNHSSGARRGPDLDPKYFGPNGGDLGGDGNPEENSSFGGPRWRRYQQTKLANCAFTYGLKQRLDAKGVTTLKAIVAHPGLAQTQLQLTTAYDGGMQHDSPIMASAQSEEDGALGIIRGCADPAAQSGDFFGPSGWTGFPEKLPPEEALFSAHNVQVNWDGCEAAVGAFEI